MPTYGSLFSGVGGFDAGLDRAGWSCAWQCELDPFCTRVLAERWPAIPRYGDVRAVALTHAPGKQQLERVDLLCGGWPCQDLSVAGKRAGLVGARSGLFHEVVRIAQALRPTWGLFENVPGLFSSHGGRDMAAVLEGLRQCWPVVGYRVLDSQHFGVAQRRRRVFFVGGPTEAGVDSVLALTEGGGGDSAPRGEAGAGVARCLAASPSGARYDGDTGTFVMAFEPKASSHQSMNPSRLAPALGTSKEPAVYDTTQITSGENRSNPKVGDPCHPLAEGAHPPLLIAGAIRHISPLECERLQNFPDGHTCLCQPLSAYAADPDAAALACTCPDSPRYRALGNAVTVSVIYYLGRRLMEAHRGE